MEIRKPSVLSTISLHFDSSESCQLTHTGAAHVMRLPGNVQANGLILNASSFLNLADILHLQPTTPRLTPSPALHQPRNIRVHLGQIPQEASSDSRGDANSEFSCCNADGNGLGPHAGESRKVAILSQPLGLASVLPGEEAAGVSWPLRRRCMLRATGRFMAFPGRG